MKLQNNMHCMMPFLLKMCMLLNVEKWVFKSLYTPSHYHSYLQEMGVGNIFAQFYLFSQQIFIESLLWATQQMTILNYLMFLYALF